MVSVQLGAALSRPLFATLGPAGTAWLRLTWAALAFLLLARPRPRRRPPGDVGAALALGLASAGMTVFFFEAIARIPLGVATTVEFLGPLAVAVTASRHPRGLGWVGCAAVGVVLIGGTGADLNPGGLGCAALAALCWASYIVLTKRVGARFNGVEGLAISLAVAAVVIAPIGLPQAVARLSPAALIATAGLALLLPVLPYVLELRALRRLDTRTFSVLMSLEPAVSALIGLVVLAQALSAPQAAGIALVVIASVGVSVLNRPAPSRPGGTEQASTAPVPDAYS
ncbi:MAG TPA: EamA family transporter [Jiangellales bacterium]|nr:EamA family transporter [Jiangellales bacterium]